MQTLGLSDPSRPVEKRAAQGAYTDALVRAIQAQAAGTSSGNPSAIAALEVAAGLWGRGFASAALESGDAARTAALDPFVLSTIGRALVRSGESLWGIDVQGGRVVLSPAYAFDINGGSSPESWIYHLDYGGPSGGERQTLPAESVLHFRYAIDPARPWRGISPLGFAAATGQLAGNLELRLGEESSARR